MQFKLDCEHPSIQTRNCSECGLYIHSGINVSGIKTENYRAMYPGSSQIAYLRKLNSKFEKSIPQYCTLPEVKQTI